MNSILICSGRTTNSESIKVYTGREDNFDWIITNPNPPNETETEEN